jgi:hypothetical protein
LNHEGHEEHEEKQVWVPCGQKEKSLNHEGHEEHEEKKRKKA